MGQEHANTLGADAQRKTGHTLMRRNPLISLVINGRRGGIRTRDPLHPMQVRYQAALHADKTQIITAEMGGHRVSKVRISINSFLSEETFLPAFPNSTSAIVNDSAGAPVSEDASSAAGSSASARCNCLLV